MRTPKLRRHYTGCGTVRLNGVDFYFQGQWPKGKKTPPPAIQEQYNLKINSWQAAGHQLPADGTMTVTELIGRYLPEADARYRQRREPGGPKEPTSEMWMVKRALRILKAFMGDLPAAEFGAKALRQYRAHLEQRVQEVGPRKGQPLGRKTINSMVWRVKLMFRWAAEHEIFPGAERVRQAVYSVRALTAEETEAPDYEPVSEPPVRHVAAAVREAPPTIAAMIRTQYRTGMRPGELVRLRAGDIDQSKTPWEYRPQHHKTKHKGKGRLILFGPRARRVLAPILAGLAPDALVFPRPKGTSYGTDGYWRAVVTACEAAGVEPWFPYQLRHAHGTAAERVAGLEGTAAVLGNTPPIARVYAHGKEELARKIQEEIG